MTEAPTPPEPHDALTLRQARPEDAAAIRALTRAAYAKWVPLIGREPLPMTADYEDALGRHRFDLLCGPGGAILALIETVAAPDHLLVENVAVAPAQQGRGLGRRLMAHAEALAREMGVPEIRLYTNGAFAANLRLYRALGYAVTREEAFRGGAVVHMARRIGAA